MKLSVIMPTYNEAATVATAVKRLIDARYPCDVEIIVVDDGSGDGTRQALEGIDDPRVIRIRHPHNRGKGAAVRSAVESASGDYMVVYDADLEYSADDIATLLQPVLRGDADVVYGTRAFGPHNAYSFWFVIGNQFVTLAANVLFNSYISDLETCFKLMPLSLYQELDIRATGFGMEAELTGKLLRRGIRIYEVPITYRARSREEGKKITWRDGVEALVILLRVRLGRDLRRARRAARAIPGSAPERLGPGG